MADDDPRFTTKAARPLQSLETVRSARRSRHNSGLGKRGEVEPIGDAFVTQRRAVHPPDKRLNTSAGAQSVVHGFALAAERRARKSAVVGMPPPHEGKAG